MKLLHPMVPKEGRDAVRVIVVVRGFSQYSSRSHGALAREYLDIVCTSPVSKLSVCDSLAVDAHHKSIQAALAKIKGEEVDVVVATDLSQISRRASAALEFVTKCVHAGVRVLTFEDHFDTADDNWEDELAGSYAIVSEHDVPTTEGGQP